MAARVSFNIDVIVDNAELIPELEERTKDLRPVFDDVIKKWARNNKDKFEASVGMESSGADVDPTVFWEPLAISSIKSKRRKGQADQIMVATGALRASLEDEEGFFHESTPLEAAFGTPMAPEEELKAAYNWKRRQVIFLGLSDMKAIESDVANYLSFGENWQDIIFARGLANSNLRREAASMDMEYNDQLNIPSDNGPSD